MVPAMTAPLHVAVALAVGVASAAGADVLIAAGARDTTPPVAAARAMGMPARLRDLGGAAAALRVSARLELVKAIASPGRLAGIFEGTVAAVLCPSRILALRSGLEGGKMY